MQKMSEEKGKEVTPPYDHVIRALEKCREQRDEATLEMILAPTAARILKQRQFDAEIDAILENQP